MKRPAGFEPENSSVYARDEIVIAASPERVWRWLIGAAKWPEWYSNSANVKFLRGDPPDLALDSEFRWKTFGATITSRVIVFEPPRELGWDAHGVLDAYHGWLIEPDSSVGCRVITEECQNGIVPKLAWWYLRPMLLRGHQNWVESLKHVVRAEIRAREMSSAIYFLRLAGALTRPTNIVGRPLPACRWRRGRHLRERRRREMASSLTGLLRMRCCCR